MDSTEIMKLFHTTYMDMASSFGITPISGNAVLNPNGVGRELLRAVWEYVLPKVEQGLRYCSDCGEDKFGEELLCEDCWRDRPYACSACENDFDELYCKECIKEELEKSIERLGEATENLRGKE